MSDVFIEHLVKAKTTIKGWAARVGAIVLVIAGPLSFVYFGIFAIVITGLLIYLTVQIFHFTNLEYEYIFVAGELDIDRIMGQIRRKRVLNVDIRENAEVVAPEQSYRIKDVSHSNMKILDYSTGEANNSKFAIITTIKGERIKIIFEPNEKMTKIMRDTIPNKVFQD